jgi:hypothetical protein
MIVVKHRHHIPSWRSIIVIYLVAWYEDTVKNLNSRFTFHISEDNPSLHEGHQNGFINYCRHLLSYLNVAAIELHLPMYEQNIIIGCR